MYYWNNWYAGWGWFLWFGVLMLFISGIGNWGYTYRAHRRFEDANYRDALRILNERYARGDFDYELYVDMKSTILSERREEISDRSEKLREIRADKKTLTYNPMK